MIAALCVSILDVAGETLVALNRVTVNGALTVVASGALASRSSPSTSIATSSTTRRRPSRCAGSRAQGPSRCADRERENRYAAQIASVNRHAAQITRLVSLDAPPSGRLRRSRPDIIPTDAPPSERIRSEWPLRAVRALVHGARHIRLRDRRSVRLRLAAAWTFSTAFWRSGPARLHADGRPHRHAGARPDRVSGQPERPPGARRGSRGVIFPTIGTPEQAADAVAMCRYPRTAAAAGDRRDSRYPILPTAPSAPTRTSRAS